MASLPTNYYSISVSAEVVTKRLLVLESYAPKYSICRVSGKGLLAYIQILNSMNSMAYFSPRHTQHTWRTENALYFTNLPDKTVKVWDIRTPD